MKQIPDQQLENLQKDFVSWGLEAVDRIITRTLAKGVLCSSDDFMINGVG